jgi:hypothetical protein
MLEAYLNQGEPLTVFLDGKSIQFTNLNSLTSSEINQIIEAIRIRNTPSTVMKKVVFSDPDNLLDNLSAYEFSQIFEEWQKWAGVTLEQISMVFDAINTYPKEFQSDLLRTNIKTITELLSLPAVDMVAVTNSLLLTDHRTYVHAAVKGWLQPMTPANTIEQMFLTFLNLMRSVFIKDSKNLSLESFAIVKTDNQYDELEPITDDSVYTKEETEDMIKRWRETGTL